MKIQQHQYPIFKIKVIDILHVINSLLQYFGFLTFHGHAWASMIRFLASQFLIKIGYVFLINWFLIKHYLCFLLIGFLQGAKHVLYTSAFYNFLIQNLEEKSES